MTKVTADRATSRQIVTFVVVTTLGLLVSTGACLWPGHPVFWRSPEAIEEYLLSRTPLGSPVSHVVNDLRRLGASRPHGELLDAVSVDVVRNQLRGGLQVHLAEYRLVFVNSVGATYWFDTDGRLTAIEVSKIADTL